MAEAEHGRLYCPHCERTLAGHDEGHCRRRMSRRFFFGLVVAPLAAKMSMPVKMFDYSMIPQTKEYLASNKLWSDVYSGGVLTREMMEQAMKLLWERRSGVYEPTYKGLLLF